MACDLSWCETGIQWDNLTQVMLGDSSVLILELFWFWQLPTVYSVHLCIHHFSHQDLLSLHGFAFSGLVHRFLQSKLGVKFKFFSEFWGNQANNQIRSLINSSWSVQKVQCSAIVCKAMTKLSTVSPSSCQRQSWTPSKRTFLHTMKCLSNVVFTVWYCFSWVLDNLD